MESLSTRELAGTDRPADEQEQATPAGRDETRADEPRVDETRADEPRVDEPRADEMRARPDTTADMAGDDTPELLSGADNDEFQRRWESIQTGFVDEPRQTVEQADELVAQVMKRLAEGFAGEREQLEQQWGRGEDVSTEDLRIALQRYRGFFQRLLAA